MPIAVNGVLGSGVTEETKRVRRKARIKRVSRSIGWPAKWFL
jgi:hypothetical protein